jgi:hypothetical protein
MELHECPFGAYRMQIEAETTVLKVTKSFQYFLPEDEGNEIRYNLYGLKDWSYIGESNPRLCTYRSSEVQNAAWLFFLPDEIIGIPERFEFVGIRKQVFADDQSKSVSLPSTGNIKTGDSTSFPIVSRSFIQALEQLGFHDYRTYPVRVYLMDVWNDIRAPRIGKEPLRAVTLEEAHERFEYTDDAYVILQLTRPALELFDEAPAIKGFQERGWAGLGQEMKTLLEGPLPSLPILYRVNMGENLLFCNSDAKLIFEQLPLVRCVPQRLGDF